MEQKYLILLFVIIVVIVVILLIFHHEIVSCDKGDHSYFTNFAEDELHDPQEAQASYMISNWSYPPNYTGSLDFDRNPGSYRIQGERVLNRVWDVNNFVKMRVEATFSEFSAGDISLVFIKSDINESEEVTFTMNDLPEHIAHRPDLVYGFDVRVGSSGTHNGEALIIRRLYDHGDVDPNASNSVEMVSTEFEHVAIKVRDAEITTLKIFWTDETPGIQGLAEEWFG